MDRRKLALLEALKTGALEGGETRLYRRGKLPGLFAQRTRLNAEAANQAVKDGLIEIVRIELAGKTNIEWARVTQKGLDYLLESESPARVLSELRDVLALNQEGMPNWVAQMNERINTLVQQHADEVQQMRQRLDQLAGRVTEAIARLEVGRSEAPTPIVPWAQTAFQFLEQRHEVGLGTRCPLAELFATLKEKDHELTIKDFHAGLKCLHQSKLIALLPSTGAGDVPGPEYAVLDGAEVYYYLRKAS
jgi:hypothetical protein